MLLSLHNMVPISSEMNAASSSLFFGICIFLPLLLVFLLGSPPGNSIGLGSLSGWDDNVNVASLCHGCSHCGIFNGRIVGLG